MPFQPNPNWRNYHIGDLIYGLREPRHNFITFLGANNICTIDEYDTFAIDRQHANLQHSPHFIYALATHPRYQTAIDHDIPAGFNSPVPAAQRLAYAAARRKCKGGLRWITQNSQRHIHFLLSGINLMQAASKQTTYPFNIPFLPPAAAGQPQNAEYPQGKSPAAVAWQDKARSITAEELRWIYRYRANARVQNQVQFWKATNVNFVLVGQNPDGSGLYQRNAGYTQCEPPWSDPAQPALVRNAWAAYNHGNSPI